MSKPVYPFAVDRHITPEHDIKVSVSGSTKNLTVPEVIHLISDLEKAIS